MAESLKNEVTTPENLNQVRAHHFDLTIPSTNKIDGNINLQEYMKYVLDNNPDVDPAVNKNLLLERLQGFGLTLENKEIVGKDFRFFRVSYESPDQNRRLRFFRRSKQKEQNKSESEYEITQLNSDKSPFDENLKLHEMGTNELDGYSAGENGILIRFKLKNGEFAQFHIHDENASIPQNFSERFHVYQTPANEENLNRRDFVALGFKVAAVTAVGGTLALALSACGGEDTQLAQAQSTLQAEKDRLAALQAEAKNKEAVERAKLSKPFAELSLPSDDECAEMLKLLKAEESTDFQSIQEIKTFLQEMAKSNIFLMSGDILKLLPTKKFLESDLYKKIKASVAQPGATIDQLRNQQGLVIIPIEHWSLNFQHLTPSQRKMHEDLLVLTEEKQKNLLKKEREAHAADVKNGTEKSKTVQNINSLIHLKQEIIKIWEGSKSDTAKQKIEGFQKDIDALEDRKKNPTLLSDDEYLFLQSDAETMGYEVDYKLLDGRKVTLIVFLTGKVPENTAGLYYNEGALPVDSKFTMPNGMEKMIDPKTNQEVLRYKVDPTKTKYPIIGLGNSDMARTIRHELNHASGMEDEYSPDMETLKSWAKGEYWMHIFDLQNKQLETAVGQDQAA